MKKWIAYNSIDSLSYQVETLDGKRVSREILDDVSCNVDVSDGLTLCAGLTDLQVNGYRGIDFGDPELDQVQAEAICRDLAAEGVTHFLATVTTQSIDGFTKVLSNLNRLAEESSLLKNMMLGIHLEGPYISAEDGPRGAHPKAFCRKPDVDEFNRLQGAAGGRIVIVTLSPEYDEAPEFIDMVSNEVIVSIGHTAASPDQIRAAVDRGASMSTHLGNGMHKEIVRHPNYLWEQIADDRLSAGLIGEGTHLDASVLKSIFRAKGAERSFLVSDSTLLAGKPPGLYSNSTLGDVEVTEDRRLVVAGQRKILAGAYRPLRDAMKFLLDNEIADRQTILQMMVSNPRRILLEKFDRSDWRDGFESSFTLFDVNADNQMNVRLTVVSDEIVFSDKTFE